MVSIKTLILGIALATSALHAQESRVTVNRTLQVVPAFRLSAAALTDSSPMTSGAAIVPLGAALQTGNDEPSASVNLEPIQKSADTNPAVVPSVTNASSGNSGAVNPADYIRIYQSIPFSRAEFNANPTFRHDSTMEILTGNPRHQTIVRHPVIDPGQRHRAARVPAPVPYRYNNRAWGLNYYFYFPYWNFRGLY